MGEGEHEVTLALIDAKLDDVIKILGKQHRAHDELEERVRANEQQVARLTERLSMIAAVLGGASLLFAAAAAVLGAMF